MQYVKMHDIERAPFLFLPGDLCRIVHGNETLGVLMYHQLNMTPKGNPTAKSPKSALKNDVLLMVIQADVVWSKLTWALCTTGKLQGYVSQRLIERVWP